MKTISALALSALLCSCGAPEAEDRPQSDGGDPSALSLVAQPGFTNRADDFALPAPRTVEELSLLRLWATWYYLPVVNAQSGGIPLRDLEGAALGPRLGLKDWCHAAMEGSVAVRSGSAIDVFNYAGATSTYHTDCSSIYSYDVGKTKFKRSTGVLGEGVRGYKLRAYRTIATDKTKIPWGTAIFIPEARGQQVLTEDGRTLIHDGYFLAGDTGGLIKGSHIDVFLGTATQSPFRWIRSTESGTFSAYIVKDATLVDELTKQAIAPLCISPGRTESGCLGMDSRTLAGWKVGIPGTLTAIAGAGVTEVQMVVDGWSLGRVPVQGERASIPFTFRGSGEKRRLEILGYDSSGAVVRTQILPLRVSP